MNKIKHLLLIGLLSAISFSLYSRTNDLSSPKTSIKISLIENYFEEAVKKEHFSGVAMVAYRGETLLNRGYGMASKTVKNQADTVVHIASITKQFTAAAILLLCEKGKIDLATPINNYLPEKYRTPKWEKITIHHLLSHTAGLIDYAVQRSYYNVRKGFCYGDTIDGMIQELRAKPLEFEPGSRFHYSNIGYTLLGVILEESSGSSCKQFIEKNILRPSQMHYTTIHDENYVQGRSDALGHRWDENLKKLVDDDMISLPVTTSDGGMVSTTKDLLKWSHVITGKTKGIISANSIKKMTTPVAKTSYPDEQYGYGLFIDESSGIKKIHHPGSIVGFKSHLCIIPAWEMTIVILCNNSTTDPEKITRGLTKLLTKLNRKKTLNLPLRTF